jgi:hypothetical protein
MQEKVSASCVVGWLVSRGAFFRDPPFQVIRWTWLVLPHVHSEGLFRIPSPNGRTSRTTQDLLYLLPGHQPNGKRALVNVTHCFAIEAVELGIRWFATRSMLPSCPSPKTSSVVQVIDGPALRPCSFCSALIIEQK